MTKCSLPSLVWVLHSLLAVITYSNFLGCADGSGGSSSSGVSGSTSRFAIVDDYLYVLDGSDVETLSIENRESPDQVNSIEIDFVAAETLYTNGELLFLGTDSGVYFMNIENREMPDPIGIIHHITARDPVVTEGTIAYATIRSQDDLREEANSLLVIDFTDLDQTSIVNSKTFSFPWGLAVNNGVIYLCDGFDGLHVVDASNPLNLKELYVLTDELCFDVVLTQTTLFTTGLTGINQYLLPQGNEQLSLISQIPVSTSTARESTP